MKAKTYMSGIWLNQPKIKSSSMKKVQLMKNLGRTLAKRAIWKYWARQNTSTPKMLMESKVKMVSASKVKRSAMWRV